MNRRLTLALLGLIFSLSAVSVAGARQDLPQFARIDAAESAGEIDADQSLLYRFQYVFDGEKLPAAYQPDERTPIRCATPLIIEYRERAADLRPEIVAAIESYLAEPAGDKATYISPLGYFQLTYTTVGADAVPAADVSPANGVPDYIELMAEYLDTSWQVEITDTGFTAPYLGPYYAISFANQGGTYGYTTVTGGTTRIVLENDYVGFPPNDDPDGDVLGAAKVTCAHEFKHASQFATSSWSEGGWVELDGTWAEDLVFDATNDYYNYLFSGNAITAPSTSLDSGGTGSYEDCIFQQWMSETWGNQIIVDLWDWRSTYPGQAMINSYNSILSANGSSIADGYAMFAAWSYACGTRSIPGVGFSEAASYPNSNVTAVSSYPYSGSGTVNHLAAKNIHCTAFIPGEPGNLHVTFDGDNTATMRLMAVILRNDGSGLIEPIALDGNNDADTVLSVALADLARVGFVIVNSATSGDNKSWNLDLSRDLPAPTATTDAATVAKTMNTDATGSETVGLSNTGTAGSQLVYQTYVMDAPPAKSAWTRTAAVVPAAADRPKPGKLEHAELAPTEKYAGDCVFGNDDTGNIQGFYSTWWAGNESYATLINPADYACACNPGFNVRAIHMILHLDPTSAPQIRVSLATSAGSCAGPGSIIETSAPITVSGVTTAGYYNIEVPCDFTCQDMNGEYYLVVEFMNAAGPVGIPVDTTPQTCVNYNDWGSGWQDVVADYGFAGDWLIFADIDCCGTPDPSSQVLTPDGGEILAVGDNLPVTWTAIAMTDVKIELSRDGGGSWEVLAASTPNDGSESFTVTGPASANCVVRVGSTDGVYTDTSAAPFWIYQSVPWLQVTPAGGILLQGESQPLTLDFDSTGLADGLYNGFLVIVSNAGTSPEVVPVDLTVESIVSGVGDVPNVFGLTGNVPNPFNPATQVRFSLARDGMAEIDVLDLQGRVVRTLLSGIMTAGEQTVRWDGRDDAGRNVASGAYFVRLRSAGQVATHKVTLMK